MALARELGVAPSTLRSHLLKHGLPTAKAEAPTDESVFTLDNLPAGANWTPDKLLKRLGLQPDEWVITNVKARGGHWGNPDDPNSQLRLEVSVAPIKDRIHAPDLTDWKPLPEPKARKRKKGEPLRAVVIGDHHCPRIEATFHRLFVQWLRDTQPDVIDINGDLLDFPSVSRHRTADEHNHSVNECLKSAVGVLRDYRDACPNARIHLKRGNHDSRLEFYAHDNAPEAKNVAPGGGVDQDGTEDARPWHHLTRLLWLDELHIEFTDESWEQAKTCLSPKLTTRHGFSTSPSAGKNMLDKLSGSTIQGHDHRLVMTMRSRHTGELDDPLEVRLAMSGGCACEIPGGLGYSTEPDWQNGAVEVDIWDNGDFYASPMVYVPGRLLTREGRYEA